MSILGSYFADSKRRESDFFKLPCSKFKTVGLFQYNICWLDFNVDIVKRLLVLIIWICPCVLILFSQSGYSQTLSLDTTLLSSDGAEGDNFGSAIAVKGDIMVIAAPWANLEEQDTSGLVYLYRRDPSSGQWVEHQHLIPAQGHYEDNISEMNLAIDDETIVVGAPFARANTLQEGAVYIFEPDDSGVWNETTRLTDISVGTVGHFGASIALQDDLLAVGAPQTSLNGHGRVAIYQRDTENENQWTLLTRLYGYESFQSSVDDAGNARYFGSAVAFKDDLLIIGSSRTSVSYLTMNDGAVYVFKRNADNLDQWDYVNRLIAPDSDSCVNGQKLSEFILTSTTEENIEARRCAQEDIHTRHDGFGETLALYGDVLVIGAPVAEHRDDAEMAGVGAAYVFQQDPSAPEQWEFKQTLQGETISGFSYFGEALAVNENAVVVGARYETVNEVQSQGAAYVYQPDDIDVDNWVEVEKLVAANGLSSTNFGEAVALDNEVIMIGANGYLGRKGAAFLHEVDPVIVDVQECSPSFGSTHTLSGTTVATHESGVMLGATQGGLTDNLPVWIEEVSAPQQPLFEQALVRGGYYSIGAECEQFASQDSPFVIGLPVPEGVDSSNLGAAVLAPHDTLVDGPGSGSYWQPVIGHYDAGSRIYMIPMGALTDEGHTVALIEHPDLAPFTVVSTPQITSSTAPVFFVTCFGFSNAGCNQSHEAKVQQFLSKAYTRFNSEGFPAPALDNKQLIWVQNVGFSVSVSQFTAYKQIFIRSSADPTCQEKGTNVLGFYDTMTATGEITVCINAATGFPSDEELEKTIAHELFHATQYAYQAVRDQGNDFADWVREGTAVAAQLSEQNMLRDDSLSLRSASIRLAEPKGDSAPQSLYPYEAQDFWVNLFRSTNSFGLKRDYNLGLLDSFLELGINTESVVERLSDSSSLGFDELSQEYWIWAKNQVAEKTDVTFDGSLVSPCTLSPQDGQADTAEVIFYPEEDQVISALEPLQSELVSIVFHDPENPGNGFDDVRIVAEGQDIKYKVYRVIDHTTDPMVLEAGCVQVEDGEESGRSFEHLSSGTVIYVLVSQTSHNEDVAPPLYRVWVDREIGP